MPSGAGQCRRGQAAGGDRRRGRRGGRAVVALGAGGRGDRDRPRRDQARGVGDEGHRVVVAAVAVVDRTGRGERLARARVPGVEGLAEGRRVAADQAAGGDRRRGRRRGRAVVDPWCWWPR